jgi:hypothetical protein
VRDKGSQSLTTLEVTGGRTIRKLAQTAATSSGGTVCESSPDYQLTALAGIRNAPEPSALGRSGRPCKCQTKENLDCNPTLLVPEGTSCRFVVVRAGVCSAQSRVKSRNSDQVPVSSLPLRYPTRAFNGYAGDSSAIRPQIASGDGLGVCTCPCSIPEA